MEIIAIQIKCSSCFGEADDLCVLSEAFSAEKEIIFADESDLALASTAFTTVLAEFAGMGSPEKVGHCGKNYINIYN